MIDLPVWAFPEIPKPKRFVIDPFRAALKRLGTHRLAVRHRDVIAAEKLNADKWPLTKWLLVGGMERRGDISTRFVYGLLNEHSPENDLIHFNIPAMRRL